MKSIIILSALVISSGVFAQERSETLKTEREIKQTQTQLKDKGQEAKMEAKDKAAQAKEKAVIQKDKANGKKEEAKDQSNNGNGYGKDKGDMTGREFGQSRAAAAKAKAQEVKTEKEAKEIIETSKKEIKETITSIDEKMVVARQKLEEKMTSGALTKEEFAEKMSELMKFEQRKNTIIIGME
ncbi:MAG: hypothetical protein HWE22_07530 [Flavobacteriales bacterium]|nr:hypothetical protein [Flavobacteriales bacterium]